MHAVIAHDHKEGDKCMQHGYSDTQPAPYSLKGLSVVRQLRILRSLDTNLFSCAKLL